MCDFADSASCVVGIGMYVKITVLTHGDEKIRNQGSLCRNYCICGRHLLLCIESSSQDSQHNGRGPPYRFGENISVSINIMIMAMATPSAASQDRGYIDHCCTTMHTAGISINWSTKGHSMHAVNHFRDTIGH